MGSSRFLPLLKASEDLFNLATSHNLVLGVKNVWVDALLCIKTPLVEWCLSTVSFQDLTNLYGVPEVNLFTDFNNHQLSLFLTWTHETLLSWKTTATCGVHARASENIWGDPNVGDNGSSRKRNVWAAAGKEDMAQSQYVKDDEKYWKAALEATGDIYETVAPMNCAPGKSKHQNNSFVL